MKDLDDINRGRIIVQTALILSPFSTIEDFDMLSELYDAGVPCCPKYLTNITLQPYEQTCRTGTCKGGRDGGRRST